MRAHKRGARVQAIFCWCDENAQAVIKLAKFAEMRHTENSIGSGIIFFDQSNLLLFYTDPDSAELQSQADFSMNITSRVATEHFRSLFEELWTESTPMAEMLEKRGMGLESLKPA